MNITIDKTKAIPIFILSQVDSDNVFYSSNILDIVTNFDDNIYLKKLFERIEWRLRSDSLARVDSLKNHNFVIAYQLFYFPYSSLFGKP